MHIYISIQLIKFKIYLFVKETLKGFIILITFLFPKIIILYYLIPCKQPQNLFIFCCADHLLKVYCELVYNCLVNPG